MNQLQRLSEKVVVTDTGYVSECYVWTLSLNGSGYGPHRREYEREVGPIPDGHTIDHLCRVRPCVRAEHLEPVTHSVNLKRAPVSGNPVNRAKTHCPRGHDYANHGAVRKDGSRRCRTCENEARRKEAA